MATLIALAPTLLDDLAWLNGPPPSCGGHQDCAEHSPEDNARWEALEARVEAGGALVARLTDGH